MNKKQKYRDLISQTFDFPQRDFKEEKALLYWNDLPLMDIIEKYGTPLRLTYLPKIGQQIQKARRLFNSAIANNDYRGDYHYCYCTKSSHFSFVVEEALKNKTFIETSSAFDFDLIKKLEEKKKIRKTATSSAMDLNHRSISTIFWKHLITATKTLFRYWIISMNWKNTVRPLSL
jgi:arginine decarboxylase